MVIGIEALLGGGCFWSGWTTQVWNERSCCHLEGGSASTMLGRHKFQWTAN